MSTTRTDAFYTGPCKLPQTHRQREFARRLEEDLEETRRDLSILLEVCDINIPRHPTPARIAAKYPDLPKP